MTKQEHLQKIKSKCQSLLALAEKRTPGKWDHHKTGYAIHGFDGFICKTEYSDGDAAKRRQENAAFIASDKTTLITAIVEAVKSAINASFATAIFAAIKSAIASADNSALWISNKYPVAPTCG